MTKSTQPAWTRWFLPGAMLLCTLLLAAGCAHDVASFSVATGGRGQPSAVAVFTDADAFARRRGFQLDSIEVMGGSKRAYYHHFDNYLTIEHRTDARQVNFTFVAHPEPYQQGVANRFRRDFIRRYPGSGVEGPVTVSRGD